MTPLSKLQQTILTCQKKPWTGKTTHGSSIVLYQRKSENEGTFADLNLNRDTKEVIQKSRRRSIETVTHLQALTEITSIKRHSSPNLQEKLNLNWFKTNFAVSNEYFKSDLAWMLVHLCPTKLFEITLSDEDLPPDNLTPRWSALNAMVSTVNVNVTAVGYCPMIPKPPNNYSVVYSITKTVQKIISKTSQVNTVITFDEAIYCKAKEIQWRFSDEFADTVIRMGGFHIAMTFLAVIGKTYEESGLEDILIESGVYGSNSVVRLLHGKAYNKGVRAHKLLLEALERIQWRSFSSWIENKNISIENEAEIEKMLKECNSLSSIGNGDELITSFDSLLKLIPPIVSILRKFKSFGKENSDSFMFWEEYLTMVHILLNYVRSERDGIWYLHLSLVAQMLPYFFAFDRINYSRWISVYLADMRLLPQTAPAVHNEFVKGHHPVKRTPNSKFNQVWTDMGIEQTINRESKTKGGIIGFSPKEGAVDRWYLTAHERSAITSATKEMSGVQEAGSSSSHKEGSVSRKRRSKGCQ